MKSLIIPLLFIPLSINPYNTELTQPVSQDYLNLKQSNQVLKSKYTSLTQENFILRAKIHELENEIHNLKK